MTMGAPVNDDSCLSLLNDRVLVEARTPLARHLADVFGDLEHVIIAIRSKPQRPRTIPAGAPTIACDTLQAVQFWSPYPDCVERSLDFAVEAQLLEPDLIVRFVTVELPIGRHVMPMVGDGHPIDLSPFPRGVDWSQLGDAALSGATSAVGTVADWYGLGPAWNAVVKVGRDEGVLPADKAAAADSDGEKAPNAPNGAKKGERDGERDASGAGGVRRNRPRREEEEARGTRTRARQGGQNDDRRNGVAARRRGGGGDHRGGGARR